VYRHWSRTCRDDGVTEQSTGPVTAVALCARESIPRRTFFTPFSLRIHLEILVVRLKVDVEIGKLFVKLTAIECSTPHVGIQTLPTYV
jgi:hypothetical protein